MTPNPWNLTRREAQTMDAICDLGCHKLAARKLQCHERTIETHAQRGRAKIGEGLPRLRALILWDRWRRGGAA